MMKSFFKKLASVLALAMVVSLAAPAAQTAAAAEAKEFTYKHTPSYSATVKTVNLAKTGDVADLRFVGIPDYTKYELTWMAVGTGFTVDQAGVITATADEGEGVVWLSVGDDQTYVSDPVKVTIGELKATIGTQDKSNKDLGTLELKVGESEDLAFYGITDWNLGKYGYKWVVGDTSVLDVDQKTGEITALKAGTTTVTFMAPNKLNTTNVVITAPLTVTVKPSEITFEVTNNGYNTTQNEVIVEFSEKYAPKSVELFRVFVADDDWTIDGKVDENLHEDAYESVYVNNHYALEGNEYLINPYVDFIDGAIYEIRIDGLAKVWFKASVGPVAKVVVKEDFKGSLVEDIEDAIPSEFSVDLYDKNNVRVDGAMVNGYTNESVEYVTFSLVEDGAYDLDENELTFFDYVAAKLVATYESPAVDAPVVSAEFTAMPYKKSVYGVEQIIKWTVWDDTNKNAIDWNAATNHWLAAEDTNRKLVVLFQDTRGEYYCTDVRGTGTNKYNGKDVYYTGVDETLFNAEGTTFADYGYYVEFKAMDPDKLLIDVDGIIKSYQKTKSRWALYLYNYKNQETQFEKEIFSAILDVDNVREMDKIDADFNEVNLMYFTEEEAGVQNAYYSDFSKKNLVIDCYDQYGASWGGATQFVITANTKGVPAFEELLDKYEDTLNGNVPADMVGSNSDTKGNVWWCRDAWLEIELADFVEADPAIGADGYAYRLLGGKTSFSFTIKEVNSGDTEKITVNFKTPTDYLVAEADNTVDGVTVAGVKKGDKVYQENAVVLERELIAGVEEELFDLSTGNTVNISYETENHWSNNIDTNGKATKDIKVIHKDSKGYQVGYENDIFVGVKTPSYNNTLKRYTIKPEYLVDAADTTTTTFATVTEDMLGAKVLIVTDPAGNALQTKSVGNANAALTSIEKKLYATQPDLLATATASGLGISINTKNTYSKAFGDGLTKIDTSYDYFNIDFMDINPSTLGGNEIDFLAAGNYKATVWTIEGFVKDANDNITDVIFSGNSLFKQTTTFKVTDKLPEIKFVKRLNATTTDYLGDVDATVHDDEHVKELIAENFQFSLDGNTYRYHNFTWSGRQITADDIIAYTVKVSSNNQIVVQNVTFKVYVDFDNLGNGDLGEWDGENNWYRSTCTVNQSLTYKPEN